MLERYPSQIPNLASHCILTFMLLAGCVKQAGPGVPDSLSDSPSEPDPAGELEVFTAAKLPAGIKLTAVSKDAIAVRTQFQISDLFSYTGSFELSEEVGALQGQFYGEEIQVGLPDGKIGIFQFPRGMDDLISLPVIISVFQHTTAAAEKMSLASPGVATQLALACTFGACGAQQLREANPEKPGGGSCSIGTSGQCDRFFFAVVERTFEHPVLTSQIVEYWRGGVARHQGAVLVCIKDGTVIAKAVGGFPESDPIDVGLVKEAFVNLGQPPNKDVDLKYQEISLACCGNLQKRLKVTAENYEDAFKRKTVAFINFAHEGKPTETCSFNCIDGRCPGGLLQTEDEFIAGVKEGILSVNCRTVVKDYQADVDRIANEDECKVIPPPLPPSDCGTITWTCRKDIVNSAINPPMWWDGGNFDGNVAGCRNKPSGKNCWPPVSMENSPCSKVYDVKSGWNDALYFLGDSVTMNCSEY